MVVHKNNLKKMREAKGFSQSQLARFTDISIRNIQCWEQHSRNLVDIYQIKKLADALETTIDELIELD